MLNSRSYGARASFQPHHGKTRRAGTSFGSRTRVGRRFASKPVESHKRYDQSRCLAPIINAYPNPHLDRSGLASVQRLSVQGALNARSERSARAACARSALTTPGGGVRRPRRQRRTGDMRCEARVGGNGNAISWLRPATRANVASMLITLSGRSAVNWQPILTASRQILPTDPPTGSFGSDARSVNLRPIDGLGVMSVEVSKVRIVTFLRPG
jgi:hypothetical protein